MRERPHNDITQSKVIHWLRADVFIAFDKVLVMHDYTQFGGNAQDVAMRAISHMRRY